MTDAAKEQIKLRATFLNGIAIATFGVGGLAPVVTALSRDDISGGTIGSLFVLSVVCLAVSGIIHSHAYRHLKGLDP
ncbi:hypothetical protein ASG54_03085 [Aureimonas sp. Leaf460]|nr:hypothetical protein ASG62_05805 [Aureimonas sp. Leaf427]KQT81654.1 hypothetical protein ASG54_03085 [Aureimonas sp. Leaf460]